MASRIKLLPENLINQIAAGEVVERPASVLKELVENSLDAGASRVEIDIEDGGRRLVRVEDNGCGLNKEELFLCLERHATSKLDAQSDLMSIGTLGFRGEALPSIASVSKMSITSSNATGEGHRLRIEGGKIIDLTPAAANQGTVIEVRDLFFNVPARRKFLKTPATETAHLTEIAQRYALSRTDLRLVFRDGGKETVKVDEKNDMASRILKILGQEAAGDLREFEQVNGDLKIKGWLAGPQLTARTGSSLFLFVLGRPVRDRLLFKAVTQGYGRTLPQGRWPQGVLLVDLDPARVDVNVHPAKTEVRFREPGVIFDLIAKAVTGIIDVSPLAPAASPITDEVEDLSEKSFRDIGGREPFPSFPVGAGPVSRTAGAIRAVARPGESDPKKFLAPFSMGKPSAHPQSKPPERDRLPPWMREDLATPQLNEPAAEPLAATGSPDPAPEELDSIYPLAQLHRSYILAQGPKGLYIIDQHAAHERILFNRLRSEMKKSGLPSQGLLFPLTIDLTPHEALAAAKLTDPLAHLGFHLEPFGGQTWAIRGLPPSLGTIEAKEALLEMLASAKSRLKHLEGAGLEMMLDDLSGSWLFSIACRAAVKAGDPLTIPEMESLIKDLSETDVGGYCPHGRPTVLTITLADLGRRFGRT
ncbi:MAG: DNA mismatch repair endonuclease MutL [Deltaproteobacteria bacterium]|jgi:DNA mismatch repair protein MutL|nr:DNA mismatch repair endonuclease MutL [Deltaproteobacteria bacterium]